MEYRVGFRILSERKPTADSRAFQVFYKYPISANLRAYVGSQGKSAGNEGLTDHSSRDVRQRVAPLQPARNAGKGPKSLSGGLGAEPPRFARCRRQRAFYLSPTG